MSILNALNILTKHNYMPRYIGIYTHTSSVFTDFHYASSQIKCIKSEQCPFLYRIEKPLHRPKGQAEPAEGRFEKKEKGEKSHERLYDRRIAPNRPIAAV